MTASDPDNAPNRRLAEADGALDGCDDIPLCVDLDGTLVETDVFHESLLALVRKDFLSLLGFPFWLLSGKASVKDQVARRVDLDVASLPYREMLIDHLRRSHAQGRKLILATGSNRKYADQIAAHLQLFDEVIASDAQTNVTGTRKCEILTDRFGEQGFDYAGNSRADLCIWPHARHALVVAPERGVEEAAQALGNVVQVFK